MPYKGGVRQGRLYDKSKNIFCFSTVGAPDLLSVTNTKCAVFLIFHQTFKTNLDLSVNSLLISQKNLKGEVKSP